MNAKTKPIRIPTKLHRKLKVEAAFIGIPLGELVVRKLTAPHPEAKPSVP